ncbi:hypothetical protein DPMN_170406 [Dreissena polymorpha]|uniref:Uncharacterized protein n=1 Tax=Dreissena polymorpha TaxID=45954 RepID=A0A9D4IEJ7_DREPO|nr:hypothetical protein DPMN_170406 [Dreissena polymorpha]
MKIGHQIFELSRGINGTNVLYKFHEDQTINVASRVFTRQNAITKTHHEHVVLRKNAPPPGGHTINVASRVLKRKNACPIVAITNVLTKFHEDWTISVTFRKEKCPAPPGSHVFLPTKTIFELVQDIIRTTFLTKFHKDRTIYVASSVTVNFRPNVLNKFHEDLTKNITSRVLTRFRGHIRTNALPKCFSTNHNNFHIKRT